MVYLFAGIWMSWKMKKKMKEKRQMLIKATRHIKIICPFFFSCSTCALSASKPTAKSKIWISTFEHYTGLEKDRRASGAAKMISRRDQVLGFIIRKSVPKGRNLSKKHFWERNTYNKAKNSAYFSSWFYEWILIQYMGFLKEGHDTWQQAKNNVMFKVHTVNIVNDWLSFYGHIGVALRYETAQPPPPYINLTW